MKAPRVDSKRQGEFRYVRVKKTDYVAHENPSYAGNAYIECLDQFENVEDLAAALERNLTWPDRADQRSATLRGQLASGLLRVMVPLPRLVDLARATIDLMMEAYRGREPLNPNRARMLQARYDANVVRRQKLGAEAITVADAEVGRIQLLEPGSERMENTIDTSELITAFFGISGAGKTESITRIANLYPSAIYHEKYGMWQIPILVIRLPSDSRNLHGLASAIIDAIDERIPDAGYKKLYEPKRSTENAAERVARAAYLLQLLAVGLVFLDESQDQKNALVRAAKKSKSTATDDPAMAAPEVESLLMSLLITTANTIGVALVFVGTNELADVFEGRLTRSRRTVGFGIPEWGRLSTTGSLSEGKEGDFELLLLTLWSYKLLREQAPLDVPMAALFWDLTQGVTDLVTKLYMSVCKRALRVGVESFDQNFVNETIKLEFRPVAAALHALRTNDPALLVRYPDIAPTDLRYGPAYLAVSTRMNRENLERQSKGKKS